MEVREAEACCGAASTMLTAEGGLCAGVARDEVGFDGLIGVVVCLGSGKPGEERAEEDQSGLSR